MFEFKFVSLSCTMTLFLYLRRYGLYCSIICSKIGKSEIGALRALGGHQTHRLAMNRVSIIVFGGDHPIFVRFLWVASKFPASRADPYIFET